MDLTPNSRSPNRATITRPTNGSAPRDARQLHIEKGELHLLIPIGAGWSHTNGPDRTLILYCPQRRRGRLLSVEGFGSPRMGARILRGPVRYDELIGGIDRRWMAAFAGFYHLLVQEGGISLTYLLANCGNDRAPLVPEEATYFASGHPRHPKAEFVEGREYEFSLATDRSITDVQAVLRRYGKRRKPSPSLGVPPAGDERGEQLSISVEPASASRHEYDTLEVRCHRCGLTFYSRDSLIGEQAECPGCDAKVTVTVVLERSPTGQGGNDSYESPGVGRARAAPGVRSGAWPGVLRIVRPLMLAPMFLAVGLMRSCWEVANDRPCLAISGIFLVPAFALIGMAIWFGGLWAGIYYSLIE